MSSNKLNVDYTLCLLFTVVRRFTVAASICIDAIKMQIQLFKMKTSYIERIDGAERGEDHSYFLSALMRSGVGGCEWLTRL